MESGEILQRGHVNRILVFLPVFGSAVSLTFFYLFLFELGYFYGGMTNLALSVLYLLPLVFYHLNLIAFGKHLLAGLFLSSIVVHSFVLFPTESYFHLFLVSAFPLVFMVFDGSEQRIRSLYSTVVAVLLIVIHFVDSNGLRPFDFVEEDVAFVRNSNLIASFLLLASSSVIYIRFIEKRATESLKLATTDSLTGLGNRRYFKDVADKQISLAHRNKTDLSLLFIDIDDFKEVNDSKGHQVGDLVLQGVAGGIRKHGRASDVLARTGGDEFQVLLHGANQQAAVQVANALRRTIYNECLELSGEAIRVSIGVAQHEEGDSIEMLAARADQGLYEDKTDFKLGRDDPSYKNIAS